MVGELPAGIINLAELSQHANEIRLPVCQIFYCERKRVAQGSPAYYSSDNL
jgi:hypothetical protein